MVDYLERAVVHPKKPRKFTTTMEAQQTVARLVGIPPDRWRSATTLQARKLDIGQRQQVVGWRDRDVCPSEECWRRKARDRGASVARCHRVRMCLRRDLLGCAFARDLDSSAGECWLQRRRGDVGARGYLKVDGGCDRNTHTRVATPEKSLTGRQGTAQSARATPGIGTEAG